MTLTDTALRKLTKEEIITLTLYLQNNINQDLKCIKKDLSGLRKTSLKLRPKLLSPGKSTIFCATKCSKSNRNLGVMSNTPDVNV